MGFDLLFDRADRSPSIEEVHELGMASKKGDVGDPRLKLVAVQDVETQDGREERQGEQAAGDAAVLEDPLFQQALRQEPSLDIGVRAFGWSSKSAFAVVRQWRGFKCLRGEPTDALVGELSSE